ncbi:MAG TPA: hypothetical protein VLA34_00600, partial [Candidatus Krumholzibacterium sp.]|nr:hypothetical protein [Candidatus Krumholzibacterium sp.]
RDALRYVYKDDGDTIAARYTGMPVRIDLWDEVTCPTCFFNPAEQGFTYVELYDTDYWMVSNQIAQQSCFHPLYRMRSRNTTSPVDHATVAFLITKYSDKVPVVGDGVAVAANSFFFGFPLWFFEHTAVDSIANTIFDEWQILDD